MTDFQREDQVFYFEGLNLKSGAVWEVYHSYCVIDRTLLLIKKEIFKTKKAAVEALEEFLQELKDEGI